MPPDHTGDGRHVRFVVRPSHSLPQDDEALDTPFGDTPEAYAFPADQRPDDDGASCRLSRMLDDSEWASGQTAATAWPGYPDWLLPRTTVVFHRDDDDDDGWGVLPLLKWPAAVVDLYYKMRHRLQDETIGWGKIVRDVVRAHPRRVEHGDERWHCFARLVTGGYRRHGAPNPHAAALRARLAPAPQGSLCFVMFRTLYVVLTRTAPCPVYRPTRPERDEGWLYLQAPPRPGRTVLPASAFASRAGPFVVEAVNVLRELSVDDAVARLDDAERQRVVVVRATPSSFLLLRVRPLARAALRCVAGPWQPSSSTLCPPLSASASLPPALGRPGVLRPGALIRTGPHAGAGLALVKHPDLAPEDGDVTFFVGRHRVAVGRCQPCRVVRYAEDGSAAEVALLDAERVLDGGLTCPGSVISGLGSGEYQVTSVREETPGEDAASDCDIRIERPSPLRALLLTAEPLGPGVKRARRD